MATIRKLRGRWQAQVRRRGMAPRAKSFDAKADAERWARQLETEIDRSGIMQDTRLAESTTLGSVLERYLIEVTPRKRSARSETSRLRSICRLPIAHCTLTTLTSADIAAYRDQRLKQVSPASVIREVNNLSHPIDYAIRDWGIHLSFALTERLFMDGSKDVTGRVAWRSLRRGDALCAVRKAMGLKRGEAIIRLGLIEITAVSTEPLNTMILDEQRGRDECRREGFPDLAPAEFAALFAATHKGCDGDTTVTRAVFEHLDDAHNLPPTLWRMRAS